MVTVGFYQGGAAEVRLGEEWHHNRLDMVSSMGAWGAPHRAFPAWDRPRVMRTVVDLLASGALRADGLPVRHFPFEQAVEAYGWLDANPNEAVKVALTTTQEECSEQAIRSSAGLRGRRRRRGGGVRWRRRRRRRRGRRAARR